MLINLKELSIEDGIDIFEMLKEIGPGENGFVNSGYNISPEDFSAYLKRNFDMSSGINLPSERVPQTIYWLYIDEKPVGMGKVRDFLNEKLLKTGGHIGYTIRPSERARGYGKIILAELIKKAKEKNITKVLLTCYESNYSSRRVIETNNGELEGITEGKCRYWIRLV